MRSILAGTFIVGMAGCSVVDFSTVEQFADLSPTTADPSQVSMFLELPPTLGVLDGSATVTFGAERTDTGERDFEVYTLQSTAQGNRRTYQLAEADLPRFRGQQGRIRAWELENRPAVNGTFSLNAEPCSRGPGPRPEDSVTVQVSYRDGVDPVSLVNAVPISSFFNATDIEDFPPC